MADTSSNRDEPTFEDLAKSLDRYAEIARARPAEFRVESLGGFPTPDQVFARSAVSLRRHAELKRSHKRVKVTGAASVTLFAVATCLVGQSSGWAAHNLNLGYGLLITGGLAAVVGGIATVLLGMTDTSSSPKGPAAPKGP